MSSPRRRVRALSLHAHYGCGNSGACCTAGWPIPVEATVLPVLQAAVASGRVAPLTRHDPLTYPDDRPADVGALLGRDARGACVFFDAAQSGGCCRVQRHASPAALPVACRQFPRIARHGAAGTDVSLSHWCPTALACLDTRVPVTIVDAPDAFPAAWTLEGLDVRGTWPPLLRPDCLLDLDAHELLEAATVDVLANTSWPLLTRLAAVSRLYERARTWRRTDGAQAPWIAVEATRWRDAWETTRRARVELHPNDAHELWGAVLETIPHAARHRVPAPLRPRLAHDHAMDRLTDAHALASVGRFLAARAFGGWIAYQGHGLRSVAAYLTAALVCVAQALAAGEGTWTRDVDRVANAIRTADLLLLHLGAPDALAASLRRWEDRPVPLRVSD